MYLPPPFQEYAGWLESGEPHVLVDVRPPVELDICRLPTDTISILVKYEYTVQYFVWSHFMDLHTELWVAFLVQLVEQQTGILKIVGSSLSLGTLCLLVLLILLYVQHF